MVYFKTKKRTAMTANLLKTRRFLPLLLTQFLGALNDNMFKNALLTLVALKMTAQSGVLSNVIAGLFILPFFLFSATAGEIADKYPRDRIARILKIAELLLMCGVALVFCWQSLPLLIVLLALMGAQSAFFGPVKYSLLPQHLQPEELIAGNAYIESTTYLAILLGLILGTLLPVPLTITLLIFLAFAGYMAARRIPLSPAPRPNSQIHKNILRVTWSNFTFLHKHRLIFKSILGATWFWIIGALVAVQIYPLCSQILNAGAGTITFFLILFSVGVAAGSWCCNYLLKGFIHATYVPLSAVGMAVSLFLLYWYTSAYPTPQSPVSFIGFFAAPHAFAISFNLFALAFWGGLYIIPLNAFMQNRAPKAYVATVIAGNNIFNALGMTLIAVFAAVFLSLGFSIPQLFLIIAVCSLAVAVYICALLPDALTRSLLQSLLRFLFHSRAEGIAEFKRAGKKVLIVANHVSLLDGVLLAAFIPERITFAIDTGWTQKWFIPIIRLLVDFYPVDPANPLSVRSLIEEIKKGRKVMIFPEGRVTVTGTMMKVYEGAAVIAAKAGAKILPLRINGAQYSKFSYLKNKVKTRWFPTITLTILPARRFELPEGAGNREGRHLVSKKLYDLMSDTMFQTADTEQNILTALSNNVSLHGKRRGMLCEIGAKPLSPAGLLRQSRALAADLQPLLEQYSRVGLLLTGSVASLLAFFALQYLGKTAVVLKRENLAACLEAAAVSAVLTEEEISELPPGIQQLNVCHLPKNRLNRLRRIFRQKMLASPQTEALVLFAGKCPLPFSHRNLLAAAAQLAVVMPLNVQDVCLNAWTPEQQAFWLSGSLYPLLNGAEVIFYPHPDHARVIAELCYERQATFVSGNGKMFAAWGTAAHPYDFVSLNYAVCCENNPLPPEVFDLWVKKFGVRLLEGWLPETAACIVSLNSRIYNRFGSYGCRLPGISFAEGCFYGDNFSQGRYCPRPAVPQEDESGFITVL